MKTTELIEKLNNVARAITAEVSDNKIIIVNTADIGWGKLASFPMFSISTRATEVSDGTSYVANWRGLNLVNIWRIFNLLEEYVTTSQEDRSEPKYYHFFSTAPILADSNYRYLAVNLNNGEYGLTNKNPVLNNFHTIFSEDRKNEMEALGLLVGFEPEEIK